MVTVTEQRKQQEQKLRLTTEKQVSLNKWQRTGSMVGALMGFSSVSAASSSQSSAVQAVVLESASCVLLDSASGKNRSSSFNGELSPSQLEALQNDAGVLFSVLSGVVVGLYAGKALWQIKENPKGVLKAVGRGAKRILSKSNFITVLGVAGMGCLAVLTMMKAPGAAATPITASGFFAPVGAAGALWGAVAGFGGFVAYKAGKFLYKTIKPYGRQPWNEIKNKFWKKEEGPSVETPRIAPVVTPKIQAPKAVVSLPDAKKEFLTAAQQTAVKIQRQQEEVPVQRPRHLERMMEKAAARPNKPNQVSKMKNGPKNGFNR